MFGRFGVVTRRVALVSAMALLGGVVVGVASSPTVVAMPSYSPGLSVVASGFTFVDPIDVALSEDQEFLYVLDDGDRIVQVDLDADTATTLTSGGSIAAGRRLAVNGDGDVFVSVTNSSGHEIILVDHTSGSQTVFKTGLGVAGPLVWEATTDRLLTAESRPTGYLGMSQEYLVAIDMSGNVTDHGRPTGTQFDHLMSRIDDIMVGPGGKISAVFHGLWSFGGYFYDAATFDYSGDAVTAGTFAQTTSLWRMWRTASSPASGLLVTSGLAYGAYDTNPISGHIITAYPSRLRMYNGYFGDRVYEGVDNSRRLFMPASVRRIAGSYSAGSGTGSPGGLSSPGGLVVGGVANDGSDTLIFAADTGNDRVVVVRPPRLHIDPLLRQGRLASNGMAEDPVATSTGNFTETFVDLPATAGLFGMDVERNYNSTDPYGSGEMGPGWTGPHGASLRRSGHGWRLVMPDGRNVIFEPDGSGGWVQPLEFNGQLTGSPPTGVVFPNAEQWSFDASGYLMSMSSWDGQTVTITRNSAGQITALASSEGPTLAFTYDSGTGRLTEVDSSDGRNVTYAYDSTTAFLESVTGPDGETTLYDTNSDGLLAEITDPSGVSVVANTFDSLGRVATQTTPGGSATFTYDDATGDTEVTTTGIAETLTFRHDADGRLLELEDPDLNRGVRTYDANGWIDSGTSRVNNTISADFDANGNPTEVIDPASGTTTYTYDSADRVETATTPTSGTTTYTYTGANRIPSTITDEDLNVTTNTVVSGLLMDSTDPDGVTTTFTYNALRQVETVTDELLNETAYTYDAAGRVETVTTPDERETAYTYDDAGRVLTVEAPDGGTTTTTYDDAGRVLTVEDATLAVTTNTYNSLGLLASTARPGLPAVTFTYTDQGELETVVEPTGGGTTTYTYGTLGRLVSVEDQLLNETVYGYDADGRQTTETAADTGVSETHYNAAGQVDWTEDPLGRRTVYTYKPNGLLESIETPAGGITSYTYDTLGRVATVTDPTGIVTTTTYTDAGRTETVATPAGTTTYGYDDAGRLDTVTNPALDDTVFTLTGDGLTETMTSPGGLLTQYTYDDAGRVETETDPAGVVTTRTWSLRGELLTEGRTGLGTAVYTYNPDGTMATALDPRNKLTQFDYDDLGRLETRTNPLGGVDAWTYNTASQVTSHTPPQITGQGLHPTVYTYDDVGRPETITDPSGRVITNDYDVAGQLTGRSATDGVTTLGYTFGYDDDGRLTSAVEPGGTATWTYDAADRLTTATTAAGRSISYAYDNAGRIASQANPDGTRLINAYDTLSRIASITPAQVMADAFTATGGSAPDGNKWTAQSNAGGSTTISSNAAQMSVANSSGSAATLVSKGASLVDSDVSLTVSFADTTSGNAERFRVFSRYTSAANNYRLELASNSTTARLYKDVAGANTQISTFTIPSVSAGTRLGVRFQTQGTTLRAKVWDDTAGSEPGSWNRTSTDSSLSGSGLPRVQVARSAGANNATIDDLSYTDPTTAPGPIVSYAYDDDSHVTGETLPGGSRTWTWTNGRVTGFSQTLPSANRSTTLGYDSSGLIETDTTGGTTTTYGYDAAAQLSSVTPSVGSATTYTYDDLGRRTDKQIGAGTPTTYSYNEASHLTGVTPPAGSATTMTYDDAGRRVGETTGATAVTSTYDLYGRLAILTRGATTQTRTYDSANTLVGLATGATSYHLDWDTNQPLPTLTGWQRNGDTTTITDGPAGWADIRTASDDVAIPTDVHGSALTTTGTAAVAQATSYDEYGATSASATFDARLGYRGELTLDNLTHLRARNYQPVTGGFTTVDPLDDLPGTPTIGNPYHYTDNNPLNRADPSGLRPRDASPGLDIHQTVPDDARLAAQRGPATGTNLPKYRVGGIKDFVAGLGTAAKNFFLDLGNLAKFVGGTLLDGAKCIFGMGCDDLIDRGRGLYNGVVDSGKQVWRAIKSVTDGGSTLDVVNELGAIGTGVDAKTCAARKSIANCAGQIVGGVAITIASGAAGGAVLNKIRGKFNNLTTRFERLGGRTMDCRRNSFLPQTRVLMGDGTTKRIAYVRVGEMVMATDPVTGERGPRRVSDTIVGDGIKDLVDIEINGNVITATDRHPFWVDDEGRWIDAEDLQVGDQLELADGTTKGVEAVSAWVAVRQVHNLTVDGIHTYYVLAGDDPVLVHNCTPLTNAEQRLLGGLADDADSVAFDVLRGRGGGASNIRGAGLQDNMSQWTLRELAHAAKQGDKQADRWIKMIKPAGSQGKGGK